MEIKSLSGKDICAIIEKSSQANVRELKIGDFEVKFGPENQGYQVQYAGMHTPSNTAEAEEQNTEQGEGFITAIQARVQEDIVNTQTLMDDPLGFEESVMNSFVYQDGVNEDQ